MHDFPPRFDGICRQIRAACPLNEVASTAPSAMEYAAREPWYSAWKWASLWRSTSRKNILMTIP